jgi:hypothetical protein
MEYCNVDVECVFCLSETVPIYMKEEVLYIFLPALILSILVSNSNSWNILVIADQSCSTRFQLVPFLFWLDRLRGMRYPREEILPVDNPFHSVL